VDSTVALNRAGVPRLEMVDMLRGFVIALMVLDHTRDYFHVSAYTFCRESTARASRSSRASC
jgi:uncharacterized membrane protein